MTDIDDKLLEQQEQEQKEQDNIGPQFEAGGDGHSKEESETSIAEEELKQYQEQREVAEQEQKDEEEELASIKLTKDDIDFYVSNHDEGIKVR